MGCGDGTLLIHLYNVVKNNTSRGGQLNEHPLYIIGADFNLEAQQTSQKNLSGSISEGNMEQPNLDTPSLMDSNTIPPQLRNSTVSILDMVNMI